MGLFGVVSGRLSGSVFWSFGAPFLIFGSPFGQFGIWGPILSKIPLVPVNKCRYKSTIAPSVAPMPPGTQPGRGRGTATGDVVSADEASSAERRGNGTRDRDQAHGTVGLSRGSCYTEEKQAEGVITTRPNHDKQPSAVQRWHTISSTSFMTEIVYTPDHINRRLHTRYYSHLKQEFGLNVPAICYSRRRNIE